MMHSFPAAVVSCLATAIAIPSAAGFVHHRPAAGAVRRPAPKISFSTTTSFPRPTSSTTPTTHLQAEKTAIFGMGCFWKPSETMLSVPGVTSSMAGYTGKSGASKAPTYADVCASRDWVEAVRVTFDDEITSYPQLLDAFFDAQEANPASRQYTSIIFSTEGEQTELAESWLARAKKEQRVDGKGLPALATTIEPATEFYRAEGYHQEFWQKNRPRFAFGVVLLAIASGALNGIIQDAGIAQNIETVSNGAFLVGALAMQAERWIDKEVVEV